ncbi:MAG TPA: FAD-dependent oxidoreductase [Roseiflexaceae bacterium]|nr:FAD-dependent oxidoreductase [Roseiflexaceae bacterium]
MAKPVILVVDDDPEVLRAVERDLRRKYSAGYRIVRADGGESALEALRQLKLRNESVALLLSDQRMPQMTGVEFLEQAMRIFPDARRALLTAYADTDAAIRAINAVKIHYYLMKPWDPPEDKLYPIVDDLLDEWQAVYRPDFDGIRVIGHRWSPDAHQVKDFLARNQVPYRWMDIESDAEARRLVEYAGAVDKPLPLVLFPDGSALHAPGQAALAEKAGFQMRATLPFYDLLIVGGGPAGLAAAVYGASEGLRTVLIEREAPGGQAGTSSRIENYLGFPQGLSGAELARRAVSQAKRFGVEVLAPQEVTEVKIDGPYRIVTLADGSSINAKAMLIATGVSYRKLDVPGVERLTGAGVYYGAAMTEALACRDEDVYIVGGANSAGQAAMFFARYARKVIMLVRGDSLAKSMSQYLIDQIGQTPNIEVRTFSSVVEAHGETSLQAVTIADARAGTQETVPASALFIFIGAMPRTDWLDGVVERDPNGFILAGSDLARDGRSPRAFDREPHLLETSVPGIFVAGDVRSGSIKRVASGVGEGSIAIQFVHRYLATL